MTINYLLVAISCTLFFVSAKGQEKAPTLTGKVNISISEGTFECDLILSDIPKIDDYFFRINSGMNILHMRSKKPDDFLIDFSKSSNDSLSTGESNAYYFKSNDANEKFLPESIQFKYVGKFPVVHDTIEDYSKTDWRGNIAFNDNSVRADGNQSAWYPILYDISNDLVLEKVKYDIQISCSDCTTLYVNGSKPVKSQFHNFRGSTPVELTLFCGNYDFAEYNNTFFINAGLKTHELKDFGELISAYKTFYANSLGIPFDQSVNFLHTTPTSTKDGFMFVSYPTITSVGWKNGLKQIVDPKYKNSYRPFIAHELGHFYFDTFFNSELGDMISEGFSEFLSLQLTEKLIGKDTYRSMIERKIKSLHDFKPVPIGKIKAESEYKNRQLYVYNYAPLVLEALKKEVGEEKMWQWMNTILTTQTEFSDYRFLKSTLQRTLGDEQRFNELINTYFENEESIESAISKINQQTD